jgi:hypothetical protein
LGASQPLSVLSHVSHIHGYNSKVVIDGKQRFLSCVGWIRQAKDQNENEEESKAF